MRSEFRSMGLTCRKCAHTRQPDEAGPEAECPKCGAVYAKLDAVVAAGGRVRSIVVPTAEEREQAALRAIEVARDPVLRAEAALANARRSGDWSAIPFEQKQEEARSVIVTTTDALPGRRITEVRGIVAGDHAFAFGALMEEFGGLLRNIVGSGRSLQTSRLMQEGRAYALAALRLRALEAAADAVVGVRLDFEEFSGANAHGVLVVVATGTAVRLAPLRATDGQGENP